MLIQSIVHADDVWGCCRPRRSSFKRATEKQMLGNTWSVLSTMAGAPDREMPSVSVTKLQVSDWLRVSSMNVHLNLRSTLKTSHKCICN
jgi:hypothetical protein